jgi:ATP-dependent RNA/DNA helicase IGHMBP2
MDELIELQRLLKIEKEEDFRQYKEHFLKNNIPHRKKKGFTWYPVVISNTEIGFGDYLILEIERTTNLNEPHQFKGGRSAALFSNTEQSEGPASLSGIIKYVSQNTLKLVLTVDELPDWAYEGKLGLNLLFDENSYKEMEIALHKVLNAEHSRLAEIRDVLLGKNKASFEKDYTTFSEPSLNSSQNKAIQNCMAAKDVAIIHGPPGTGKTTTLVQVIRHTLKTQSQVLVCSPSNTAVDLLTEKLSEQGINVLRLGNPVRISENILSKTLDARILAHPSYKDLKQYRKLAEEYRSMAQKYKRKFGREEREQRNLLFSESKKILNEAAVLEDFIINEQFNTVQVIACTLVAAANRHLRSKQFSTVFIDEAAQALEPACWIPITRANKVVFAGDHLQLPPTIKSKVADGQGLGKTLFEKCIKRPDMAVMLDTQYRMHEKIMSFPSASFYNNLLKADSTVRDTRLSYDENEPLLNIPFDFIDTAGCGFTEILNTESLSTSNPEEAVLLLKHLSSLLEAYEKTGNKEKLSIGIISPYKEQIQFLTEHLTTYPVLEKYQKQIAIKTVDGFQGQERDVIYISMARSNDKGEIGFLSDTRRMNVALTRAKKKLVVIGDSATLSYHPFYKKFLDYGEVKNAYKSAWEFYTD